MGGVWHDIGYSIRQTSDGGYILTGSTRSNNGDVSGNHGSDTADVWVVKLSAVGVIQWQKCYGGSLNDEGRSILPTADGGYILTGYAYSQ